MLQGIIGNVGLAIQDSDKSDPIYESLEGIRSSAIHAANLTKQMLAFSGRGSLEISTFSLADTVEKMQQLIDASVSKKISVDIDSTTENTNIVGDKTQIRQVLLNLITNSSEAIGTGKGRITIRIQNRLCSDAELKQTVGSPGLTSGKYAVLEVSDNGAGIEAGDVNKIFDPFFSTKFTGRGLGLAAVMGIIKGHKGGIKAESKVKEGTRITVYFPLTDGLAERSKGDRSKLTGRKYDGYVLLADDEPAVRNVVKKMLERLGFVVKTANNGEEAVALFNNHHDDLKLVILDYQMPLMTGDEVMKIIQKIDDQVPVILSSGYNETDAMLTFSDGSFAGFIQKPYDLKAILEKIKEILP